MDFRPALFAIRICLVEIITPVNHVKYCKAHGEHNPGENVNLLCSKCPGCHPHVELVAEPGGCGGGEEGDQLHRLLLHSPHQRGLQSP